MKRGEKKKMFWFQGGIIILTTIIFMFAWSFAHAVQPQVAAGGYHTVGLKSDGTVVAEGHNDYGQLDVESWTGIIQVAAGYYHTVGLKANGTVLGAGLNGAGQLDVESWTGIIQVAAGIGETIGLKADGTMVAVGNNFYGQLNVESWTDIVQVAAGYDYTVGLKENGTVVAVGRDMEDQLDVGSWTDIVQVAASNTSLHTVGLKSNGSVVAVGFNDDGQLNVGSWTEIAQVAAGSWHTVGLKADGTAVAVGLNEYGELNVKSWRNIIQVAAGQVHTVGLKADGSVVAVGSNDYGQCNTSEWDLGRAFVLTTVKAGAGLGSVTSEPAGITCGSDCSEGYEEGTVVTLTASSETGSEFRGWSGGVCSGTGTCVVSMSASTNVTATFTLPTELSPAEGTLGTVLTITGSDFGNKKGKVLIGGVATKIAKDGWKPGSITCTVTKVPVFWDKPHDVMITSKAIGSITLPKTFTVKLLQPVFDPGVNDHGAPGQPITINGNFYGNKKGKVYLGYLGKNTNCKITDWNMTSITFLIPKNLAEGEYLLNISNKIAGVYGVNFTIDLPLPASVFSMLSKQNLGRTLARPHLKLHIPPLYGDL